jgi:hypothetical protein
LYCSLTFQSQPINIPQGLESLASQNRLASLGTSSRSSEKPSSILDKASSSPESDGSDKVRPPTVRPTSQTFEPTRPNGAKLTVVDVTGTTTGLQWEATYRNKKTKERQQRAKEHKQQQSAGGLESGSSVATPETEAATTA